MILFDRPKVVRFPLLQARNTMPMISCFAPWILQCRLLTGRAGTRGFDRGNVFVGNLLVDTSTEDLRDQFSAIGDITNVRIHKKAGQKTSFGFIEFKEAHSAEDAIEKMDGCEMHGKALSVKMAKRRSASSLGDQDAAVVAALRGCKPTLKAVAGVLEKQKPELKAPQFREILSHLARKKEAKRAILVCQSIPKHQRNTIHYSITISACGKGGQWEAALRLFDEMAEVGVERNVYSYNSAISACSKGGQCEAALRLFDEMAEVGVERDVITYSSAISACDKGGQWEEALRLFDEMAEVGVERDVITYNVLLNAIGEEPDLAQRLFLDAYHLGLFAAPRRSSKSWFLDLHNHSEGSAITAVRWWLEEEVEPWLLEVGRDSSIDAEVGLITGYGKSRSEWQQSDVKERVANLLVKMQVPLKENCPNPGRLAIDCGRWREQLLSQKPVYE